MKRILNYTLTAFLAVLTAGCSYLDVDPELGMSEEDVFGTYKNFRKYFDSVYGYKKNNADYNITLGSTNEVDMNRYRMTFYSTTDAADGGRYFRTQTEFKSCNLSQDLLNTFTFATSSSTASVSPPIAAAMFRCIRVCNMSISHIGSLTNATQEQVDDLLGQAYFVRAYAHFVLVRYFGGMPYLDKVLGGDDEWDIPRLTVNETLNRCAEDFQTAYEYMNKAGKMRRDARPGQAGHLSHSEMKIPNGCAALAMKARALLYAASPLNNIGGKNDWEKAAQAAAEAVIAAEEYGYEMLPFSKYEDNFYGYDYTNEHIWAHAMGSARNNGSNWGGFYTRAQGPGQSKHSGTCPTQNFVDKFETAAGDPLDSEQAREAAEAAGTYNEQNPYYGRDPRFYKVIVYDGATTDYSTEPIKIHYDPDTKAWPKTTFTTPSGKVQSQFGYSVNYQPTNTALGVSRTGYYLKKWWRGDLGTSDAKYYKRSDPLIRMAELYLNYAEAVNEAYGPSGRAGECAYTAKDAVNMVRARAGMPPVQDRFTGESDAFRERIHNERNVELAFEGHHYYFDIRRWKTAPQSMTQTSYGIEITKVPVSAEYPAGRKYERVALPEARQSTWKDCMYWLPFPDTQANTMTNFKNNAPWQ